MTAKPMKILETTTGSKRGETIGREQRQLIINKTKKEKKHLFFVWSLDHNLSDLSGPTCTKSNMKAPADIACKMIETHKPPTTTRC